jgi:PhzF family phenazine biosynthesis protein
MMKYYVVDVFTDHLFGGNPAGVCLLDSWPADETLQNIAAENNLSETAFLLKSSDGYDLRWFTPTLEIDLCGHATMGGAFVLFTFVETAASELRFSTQSGILTVTKGEDGRLWMDFPARPALSAPNYPALAAGLRGVRFETCQSADILAVLDSEETVKNIQPDFEAIKKVGAEAAMPDNNYGVIITAPGSDCDFVSRYFAPNAGVDEDPVTGRSHCLLIPYWSKRLGKLKMTARQLSRRGGWLWCEDAGERVKIGGRVKLYLTGEIKARTD